MHGRKSEGRVGSCSRLQRVRARRSASVIGARPGLRDVIPRSRSRVEDLTWIERREAAQTVVRVIDRARTDESWLMMLTDYLAGDAQGRRLTLEKPDVTRRKEGEDG